MQRRVFVETKTITQPDGAPRKVDLYARGGAIGIGTLAADGELLFVPLPRVRTHRNADKGGYRWYNDYRLPDHLGGGTITVRLHGNDERREAPKFNRTENIRPIPPERPRLHAALPATQRRRVDQPGPRRHPLAPPGPLASATRRQPSTCSPTPSMVNSLALARHRQPVAIAA